ncbi:MAG: DNA-protecting protein DprA [Desulfobacteraceae bacterium]|nr:DNA-protecting protein DprA [Desulfobacteraceae bacterium]MBC2763541.1 DNA-protecting protein DprA [ANME-2 cluster archaeon]
MAPWLALKNVNGVGNHLYKRLIDRFETPEKVFGAKKSELIWVSGVSERIAGAIKGFRFSDSIKNEIALAEKQQCRIITSADPEYPPLLHHIPDPPPYIYVKGRLEETDKSVAVVGSRNASSYGKSMATRLSRELASLGLNIVSGMARGIDTAAHMGAISAKGRTFAVLGSGLGVIYPPENRRLHDEIIENGAVISEFPIMEEPNAYNFPARNRIISGMTLGTLVVEATQRSGSLITARLAGEQGREVFAVPGSINSAKSIGAHNLLKQGAKLVACAQDVVEEFYHFENSIKSTDPPADKCSNLKSQLLLDLSGEESHIYEVLEPYPIHIDELSRQTAMNVGKLSIILLNLELKGLVSQSPGKYFTVC